MVEGKTNWSDTNGAIAGLVSITASVKTTIGQAIIIGGIGGILYVWYEIVNKLKIDDVVGAIPAHNCRDMGQ